MKKPTSLFGRKSHVCSIPTGVSFVDALAYGLLQEVAGDPFALSAMTILLPNRRACRAVQDAFLRLGATDGRALLLPRLTPLGDLDDNDVGLQAIALDLSLGEDLSDPLPPAMPKMRRHLLLARLVQAAATATLPRGSDMSFDQAVSLAAELAQLLDQVEIERLDFADIQKLAPAELAEHWQLTLRFLDILQQNWPEILRREGAVDVAKRRNLLLDRQARLWRERPPKNPIIAAGSTGSIPASADLIAAVATLPQGLVVLPGLDAHAQDNQWYEILSDAAHPQFGLSQLLKRLDVERPEVWLWPYFLPAGPRHSAPTVRAHIVSAALLPAEITKEWPSIAAKLSGEAELGWRDVQRIDCPTEQEEAGAIALMLREAVAQPAPYRAGLVTPDRRLARRVASELRRWGIVINDSAGTALPMTSHGLFFRLITDALAEELAPVPLLALLKHPLSAAGMNRVDFQRHVHLLERKILRGPRPAPGLIGLEIALESAEHLSDTDRQSLRNLLDRLTILLGRLGSWSDDLSLSDRLTRQVDFAEALAMRPDTTDGSCLWQGEAGEALAGFVVEMLQACSDIAFIDSRAYAALIVELMNEVDVRPRYGLHPRLFIWGPLEARLQQVDLMILGGLNEGVWPNGVTVDPWFSRPMRREFGLPPLERKIGLAAHDFQQALGAPQVVMTRAQRVDGKPSVPSRWLLRLDAFLRALGHVEPIEAGNQYLRWQSRLDRPDKVIASARPAPTPGARFRPTELPVTDIEKWMRDPYVLYARRILKLIPLNPLDQNADAADLGNLFHHILDCFFKETPLPLMNEALARLIEIGEREFTRYGARPAVWAFWWPRFRQMASWFVTQMREREHMLATVVTESVGRVKIDNITPPFTVTAKADRIDIQHNGYLTIIDYKTGKPPKSQDVFFGFSPQLPLEAVIASNGGFDKVPSAIVAALEFWHLKSGRDGSAIVSVKDPQTGAPADPMMLAVEAFQGLKNLVTHFSHEGAAYIARPRGEFGLSHNDYDHLARYAEWSTEGDS